MQRVPEYSNTELQTALDEMTLKAGVLEARVESLEEELFRVREWRQSALLAVVAVASLAILLLGIVAFNAVDALEGAHTTGDAGAATAA